MPRGVPKSGFRMTSKKRRLAAAGVSLNEQLQARAQGIYLNVPAPGKAVPAAELLDEPEDVIRDRLTKRFAALNAMTIAVAKNQIPSMIVAGPAGLGKTFEIERELKKKKPKYTFIKGHITPGGLYAALYAAAAPGSVIVFDDADSIFNDETSLNLLKAATDSTDERHLSWMSMSELRDAEGALLPNRFQFEGSVIFITNLDFDLAIERGSRMAPHFEALISRAHYLDLGMKNKKDYIVRIKDVVFGSNMIQNLGLSQSDAKEIVAFIESNKDKMRELSLRMVTKMAHLMRMDRKSWKSTAEITLMK